MPLTNAFAQQAINHFLRAQGVATTPSYLTLSSTNPSVDGTGVVELLGITRQFVDFGAPVGNLSRNASDITFTNTSGTTWSIAALCLFSAASGGVLQAYATGLSASIPDGEIYRVFANDLAFTLA